LSRPTRLIGRPRSSTLPFLACLICWCRGLWASS